MNEEQRTRHNRIALALHYIALEEAKKAAMFDGAMQGHMTNKLWSWPRTPGRVWLESFSRPLPFAVQYDPLSMYKPPAAPWWYLIRVARDRWGLPYGDELAVPANDR